MTIFNGWYIGSEFGYLMEMCREQSETFCDFG